MFKNIVKKIVGDPTQKYLDSLLPIVEQVEEYSAAFQDVPDEMLREKTTELRERLENGEALEDILPEAFALVREASIRTTGMRHYDVQIMGGVLLHRGEVVEMRTGEGKTLVATLPLYLNALTEHGVHLVTVNDYLARRDGGWMGKIYNLLGLSVGCIGPLQFSALYDPDYVNPGSELEDERLVHWRPCSRTEAYLADITYGTSSEFGFDYLRDNMVRQPDQLVQRELHYAIIDEVDNVLIDEARTPLIISGPSGIASQDYVRFAQYVRRLKRNTAEDDEDPDGHYDIDEKSRSISLTELGISEIENRIPEINPDLGESLYEPRFFHLTYYVDNALKAQYMFQRDKKYVVQNGQVIIVDDFTGRLMPGRRYSDGLHEAIEAKEGVQVRRENVTVATITLQNYFRLYEKLAGMTGTAMTDSEEFHDMYDLDVTPLPTNVEYIVSTGQMGLEEKRSKIEGADHVYYVQPEKPDEMVFSKRVDFADQVYGTKQAKDQAIISEIKRVLDTGRPILVGTTSVQHSETIHHLLEKQKIDHSVLNAKLHQSEALTVAQAGRMRGVTISTNMAGRGTDILLGGNPEGLASETLEKNLFTRQDLIQLAHHLLTEGRDQALDFAGKHPKLTEDLVSAIEDEKSRFDSALVEIEEIQVIGYLAKSLQEPYDIDFNQARTALRLIRSGQLTAAREFLDENGKDVALVDDAVRLTDLYSRYHMAASDPRKAASFLAETLFDKLYNARAAIIRSLISDDRQEAERLVKIMPGLTHDIIDQVDQIIDQTKRERDQVQHLGGLHVIGSERHESRRIDNQLRGRAARQGDQGSSRFFLSLEDDLMLRFGGERLKNFMARTNVPDDMPIESGLLDRIIESSQERIEGYNFDIRKNVVEYDDVMSQQRTAIYNQRRSILLSEDIDLDSQIATSFEHSIDELIENYLENYPGYLGGEIERAVTDFSTDATDAININGVLIRMRALLPGVTHLDRAELADVDAEELTELLMNLAYENLEDGTNLYQFLQAASRFIPLLPLVPNLGSLLSQRPSGQIKLREKVRTQFLLEVEQVFNGFLADNIDEQDKENIWNRTVEQLTDAFSQFNVEGLSKQAIISQQVGFRQKVGSILRDLLIDSLSSLDSDELRSSLSSYVQSQQEIWRKNIGEEEFRNFQRLLLLDAIDREWRDYLVAMDDLRREIGLEAFAQRDPKVEYKRRSFHMFADMRTNIDRAIAESYFQRIVRHQAYIRQQEASVAYQEQLNQAGYQVVKKEKGRGVELRRDTPKVGRNDPCPCGSGKKYKQCHLRKDMAQLKATGRKG